MSNWLAVVQRLLVNSGPNFQWCDSVIIIVKLFFQANYLNALQQMDCHHFRLLSARDYYKCKFG